MSATAEELIRTTARAFLSDAAVVVVDLLIRNSYGTPEEEIIRKLRLSQTIVKAALGELNTARLAFRDVRAPVTEAPKPPPTATTASSSSGPQPLQYTKKQRMRTYWVVDYPKATNAIRYRLHALLSPGTSMARKVGSGGGGSGSGSGSSGDAYSEIAFVCPKQDCERTYTLVEATAGADPRSGTFRCLRCRTELLPPTEAQLEAQRRAAADNPEAVRRREEAGAALRPLAEMLKQVLEKPLPEFKKLTPQEEEIVAMAEKDAAEAEGRAAAAAGDDRHGGGAAGPASMIVDIATGLPAGAMPSADSMGDKAKAKVAVPWLTSSQITTTQPVAPPSQHPQRQRPTAPVMSATTVVIPEVAPVVEQPPAVASTVVTVAGRSLAFEDVSEQDKAQMTDAELEAYSTILYERTGGF
jgi:transcription initiation factor IIE alpha subunit